MKKMASIKVLVSDYLVQNSTNVKALFLLAGFITGIKGSL